MSLKGLGLCRHPDDAASVGSQLMRKHRASGLSLLQEWDRGTVCEHAQLTLRPGASGGEALFTPGSNLWPAQVRTSQLQCNILCIFIIIIIISFLFSL